MNMAGVTQRPVLCRDKRSKRVGSDTHAKAVTNNRLDIV